MVFCQRLITFTDKYPTVDSFVKFKTLTRHLSSEYQKTLEEYGSYLTGSFEAAIDRLDRMFSCVNHSKIMVDKIKEIGEVYSTSEMSKLEEFHKSSIKLNNKEQARLLSATIVMFFSEALKQLWRKHTSLAMSPRIF